MHGLLFIIFTLIGTTMLFIEVNDFTNNLKNLNPNYPFPKLLECRLGFVDNVTTQSRAPQ